MRDIVTQACEVTISFVAIYYYRRKFGSRTLSLVRRQQQFNYDMHGRRMLLMTIIMTCLSIGSHSVVCTLYGIAFVGANKFKRSMSRDARECVDLCNYTIYT